MEPNKQVDAIVKEISDNINTIKTKGEAQDVQLKALDAENSSQPMAAWR